VNDVAPGILYVDREREARLVLTRFLDRCAPVRAVESMAEARAALEQETPALIVIDPDLADGDGTVLLSEVSARSPWVQTFVLCSPTWADKTSLFIAAGAADVAVKPFDVGMLAPRCTRLLRAAEVARRDRLYRRELEVRLIHAERIATLGTLCATVAHEVANPLSLIVMNASLLAKTIAALPVDGPTRDELLEPTEDIATATSLIESFITRIRLFSRRQEERRVTGPLSAVVDTALLFLKSRIGASHVRLVRPAGQSPVAPHFPIRLTQALLNVVTNALDALGNEGTLTISYVQERDAGLVGLSVADDGPGLPDEVKAHLFEPFYTTKATGTGLGLMLIRTIMQEHDGVFSIESGSKGTLARLLLPER
jgi:two-component system, NtrC family, sensor histidine kinase HydH